MRSPKGNMIQEDTKYSNKNLKRLRRIKPSGKKSDVFSCLTFTPPPVIPVVSTSSKKEIDYDKRVERYKLSEEQRSENKKARRVVKIFKINEELVKLSAIQTPNKGQRRRLRKIKRRLGLLPKKVRKPRDLKISKRKRKPSKYDTYMKGPLWTMRKNKLFQSFPKICSICSSVSHITVHHLRYESSEFGNERDKDLAILCWKCHTDFHKKYGVTKDCHKEFTEFKLIKR